MGEGGCNPEYFMTKMCRPEAADFVKGMDKRGRLNCYLSRLIVNVMSKCLTGESVDLKFAWEKDELEGDEDERSEEEALEELYEETRRRQAMLDKELKCDNEVQDD